MRGGTKQEIESWDPDRSKVVKLPLGKERRDVRRLCILIAKLYVPTNAGGRCQSQNDKQRSRHRPLLQATRQKPYR